MPDNMTPEIDIDIPEVKAKAKKLVPIGTIRKHAKRPQAVNPRMEKERPKDDEDYIDIEPEDIEEVTDKEKEPSRSEGGANLPPNLPPIPPHHTEPESEGDDDSKNKKGNKYELSSSDQRNFGELQKRLEDLADDEFITTEDGEVKALMKQRNAILDEAREEGFLTAPDFIKFKGTIELMQKSIKEGAYTFDETKDEIAETDTDVVEDKIKRKLGNHWDPKFIGLVDAYKNSTLQVMEHAWNKAMSVSAQTKQERDEWKEKADDSERRVRILSWGSIPKDIDIIARIAAKPATSLGKEISTGVHEGMRKARKEEEPSLELSLELFHKAERTCSGYEPDDLRIIKQRVKARENIEEIDLFDREVKVFHAALLKRKGYLTMKGVAENTALKDISSPDIIHLLKKMPGYLAAMQEIAREVQYQENIPGLDYRLADCANDDEFQKAAERLDEIISPIIWAANPSKPEEEIKNLTQRAVNTAINTFYAFNVFERYKYIWKEERGRMVRYKGKEHSDLFYDRLVEKPIADSMNPIDDLIAEAVKPESKKTKNNIAQWAATQMADQGVLRTKIEKPEDLKKVKKIELLSIEDNEIAYWDFDRGTLFVPPIRPYKIGDSILDANRVNLTEKETVRSGFLGLRQEEKPIKKTFLEALAGYYDKNGQHHNYDIDLDNTGLAVNFCANYMISSGDLDTIKDAFRDKLEIKNWPDIKNALNSFELGENMEVIAWLYVDLTDAIDPKSRPPKLFSSIIKSGTIQRWQLGLQDWNDNSNEFNIVKFVRNWKRSKKK